MSYQINRECWNEKTYNGYTDNPYWRIDVNGLSFGLKDNGEYWMIGNYQQESNEYSKLINKIILECKINIKNIKPIQN